MATRRQLFFYVDVNEGILRNLDWGTVNAQDFSIVLRDSCVLCLYFKKRPIGAGAGPESYQDFSPPVGGSLYFTIKDDANLAAATMLVSSLPTAWNVAGDWVEAAAGSAKQSVKINCNTTELVAAFATPPETYLDLTAEVEMLESGETEPTTLFINPVRVRHDVRQGNEGSPTPTTPTYMTAADFASQMAGYFQRDADGNLWSVKNGERINNVT